MVLVNEFSRCIHHVLGSRMRKGCLPLQLNFTFHLFQNCSRMAMLTLAAAAVKATLSAVQRGCLQPKRTEYSISLPTW